MIIQKCGTLVPPPVIPEVLTYSQICEKEGVYQLVSDPTTYLIVLAKNGVVQSILYYRGTSLETAASTWNASHDTFKRTTKKVVFDLVYG